MGVCMTGLCRRSAPAVGALALLIAAAAWCDDARAGAVVAHATDAERLLDAGDAEGALAAFDLATDAFWDASPLQFNVVTFADWIAGYGKYEPRADKPFDQEATALIYVEPVAYSLAKNGDTYSIDLAADLEIRTPGGLILTKTEDFTSLDWQGRVKNRAFNAAISLGLPHLSAGDYQLLLTLRDPASGKSATATLPFSVGE